MIMDGLDTLSQVALADQLNISFDSYQAGTPPATLGQGIGRTMAEFTDGGNLNTPVTTSSDVSFNFNPDLELSQEALPITGEYLVFISIFKTVFPDIRIPIIKIRRS